LDLFNGNNKIKYIEHLSVCFHKINQNKRNWI